MREITRLCFAQPYWWKGHNWDSGPTPFPWHPRISICANAQVVFPEEFWRPTDVPTATFFSFPARMVAPSRRLGANWRRLTKRSMSARLGVRTEKNFWCSLSMEFASTSGADQEISPILPHQHDRYSTSPATPRPKAPHPLTTFNPVAKAI